MAIVDNHPQLKTLIMVRAFLVEQHIGRCSAKLLLRVLLQQRLEVALDLLGVGPLD